MRILIIGGTRFVGHAIAEAALTAGHEVTLLHRTATEELPEATHLLADRDGDLSVLADQTWDATVDVCCYLPRQARALHDALGDRGGHHVFVSTVSVYDDPPEAGADEDADLLPEADAEVDEVSGATYGPLKVACESVVSELYDERLTVIRPTFVVGPRDVTGRYPWWVLRAARGGSMISPGPDEAAMQCIDARDLGAWTVHLIEAGITGVFTAARPRTTFGEFLADTVAATGSDAELVAVDGEYLAEQGVDGAQLPLWSGGGDEFVLALDTSRAEAAGLTHRPMADVVRDTLAWAEADPQAATNPHLGISAEREQELLSGWAAEHGA